MSLFLLSTMVHGQITCGDLKGLYQGSSCCGPDTANNAVCNDTYTPAQKRCHSLVAATFASEHEGVITGVNSDDAHVCEVRGYVVDRASPFQVLIPYSFNGTYHHDAQAGYRDALPDLKIDDPAVLGGLARSTAAQGYPETPEMFWNNPYLAKRWMNKETEIRAVKLIKTIVELVADAPITSSTASGCSGGGETLLKMLWNSDACGLFDGVMIFDPVPGYDWIDHMTLQNMENERISTATWDKSRYFSSQYCDAQDGVHDAKSHAFCDYHPSKFNCTAMGTTSFCFSAEELAELTPLYDTLTDISVVASTFVGLESGTAPWDYRRLTDRGLLSPNLMINDLYIADTTHAAARAKVELSMPYVLSTYIDVNYLRKGKNSTCTEEKVIVVTDAHDSVAPASLAKNAFDGLGQAESDKAFFDVPGLGHCAVTVQVDAHAIIHEWVRTGIKPSQITSGSETYCPFGKRWDATSAECVAQNILSEAFEISTQPANTTFCALTPDESPATTCQFYKSRGWCGFTSKCKTTCSINSEVCGSTY